MKDHSQCNKQIDDLEKELRSLTCERNQLLKQRNLNPLMGSKGEDKENASAQEKQELQRLNQTVKELQSKIEKAAAISEQKKKLEDERDATLAELESKKKEIDELTKQIVKVKTSFVSQEGQFRTELEQARAAAALEKTQLEQRIARLELDLQTKETEKVEQAKEMMARLESGEKKTLAVLEKHGAELERIQAEHVEKYRQLENDLQQLAAEHDAESEQIKFELQRQIDELNGQHIAALSRLNAEHNVHLDELRETHRQEIERLNAACDQLKTDKIQLIQEKDQIASSLTDATAEVEALKALQQSEKEKFDEDIRQAELNLQSATVALEQEMEEAKAALVEEQAAKERSLAEVFSVEKAALTESINELAALLQAKQDDLVRSEQQRAEESRLFQDQLQRLTENTQTEKEILVWQMNQEKAEHEQALKTEHERQMVEKDGQFENVRADLETRLNQAKEEYDARVEDLLGEHQAQLDAHRRSHDEAVRNLEHQKGTIISERDTVLRQLAEKEADLEELTNEMNKTTAQLQLDLQLLRESNEGLVADVELVRRQKIESEERLMAEMDEARARADDEKCAVVSSYEDLVKTLRTLVDERDRQLAELGEKMSDAEASARQLLDAKVTDLERLRASHVAELERLSTGQKEEVLCLHARYEGVILGMEDKFADDTEKLNRRHLHELEASAVSSRQEMQSLQAEFHQAVQVLETKFAAEREAMARTRDQETADLVEIHEEKLKLMRQEHEVVVDELRRNCDEATENLRELRDELDEARFESRALTDAAQEKRVQHLADIESWNDTLNAKERELIELRQHLQERERQTADEWIQRETQLMDQYSARARQTAADHEVLLGTVEDEKRRLQAALGQAEKQRDDALAEVEVFQIKMDAQLAAMEEQHEEERAMMQARWSQQVQEVGALHQTQQVQLERRRDELERQLDEVQQQNQQLRLESQRAVEQLERRHQEMLSRQAAEAESEMDELRRHYEDYLLLKNQYQELQALVEPFREQLEMFEAEKNALYNQAQSAENTMASLASKYTQLLGHQNNKQKIHHLDKLKQDIFHLRKDCADARLAYEKEKKARQKVEARLKELTGQRKYDPNEAFKVPDAPVVAAAPAPAGRSSAKAPPPARSGAAKVEAKEPRVAKERVPLRSQPKGAFFVSMAEIEATQLEMEQEKQRQFQARRQNSNQFEAFTVDFDTNSRRETFDVPPKSLNVTRNLDNKENVRGGFINDLSDISMAEEVAPKSASKSNHHRPDVLTSTPLSVQRQSIN